MAMSKPFLDRYVGYTYDLYFSDKIVKILGYGLGTLSGCGRLLGYENERVLSGLDALSGEISMARMVYRLTNGLTQSLEALKNDSWAGGDWQDKRIKKIYKAMAWCNLGYHVGEAWGWAAAYAPEAVPLPASSAKFWAVTCYTWLAYVVLELWACRLKLRELARKRAVLEKCLEARPDDVKIRAALAAARLGQRGAAVQAVRLLLFLPNAYHWALEDGCLPKLAVNLFGLAEAVLGTATTFPPGGPPAAPPAAAVAAGAPALGVAGGGCPFGFGKKKEEGKDWKGAPAPTAPPAKQLAAGTGKETPMLASGGCPFGFGKKADEAAEMITEPATLAVKAAGGGGGCPMGHGKGGEGKGEIGAMPGKTSSNKGEQWEVVRNDKKGQKKKKKKKSEETANDTPEEVSHLQDEVSS